MKHQTTALMLVCGAATSAALPPLHITPLAIITLATLFHTLNHNKKTSANILHTFTFAASYFATNLWWIAVAFSNETSYLKYFALPALILIITINAAIWTLAALPLAYLKSTTQKLLAFPAAFTLAELVRAHLLGGFPWNPISSIWTASTLTLQPLAWIGSDLLSATTLWTASALAVTVAYLTKKPRAGIQPSKQNIPLVAVTVVALLATPTLIIAAAPRLLHETQYISSARLHLVQPNIPQKNKWLPEIRVQNLRKQTRLLAQNQNATHSILPEATVVWPLNRSPGIRLQLAQAVPQNGALIAGGTTRLQNDTLHNSVFVIQNNGNITARYDKHKLVPFGEYVPFRRFIPLRKLTHGATDYSPGAGPRLTSAPGLPPFSPLICFEAVFSGRVTPAERPRWLLNLTNDAWFGNTPGPFQHLAAARMRAAEEGLPLVRVANNGVSAVIDGHGRILADIPLNRADSLVSPLPQPLRETPFARFGLLLPLLAAAVWLAAAVIPAVIPALGHRRARET
ncbi:MAG: apolipoprotein N-acyltransferase [Alphaproteobacteria bacterium]|nr:apolipoprotein N-acyltransferase [Alphaproteobacteria bacterium]MDA7983399.1 apolipoprotein N-acyltransferase [Alphaproteobacteria bacterium]MDA7989024.1 apolipoprotein N-acyltransferase [Alphaproteobacteria bacterium]MDA8010017.1 apolipoprotein N-acyltransferase [Alphaproteobacteria bacterium]